MLIQLELLPDPQLGAASRALHRGDVLLALRLLASRTDPVARVLRGIALGKLDETKAALGELREAEQQLLLAGRGLDTLRAKAARLEIESRSEPDPALIAGQLEGVEAGLEAHGDRHNAGYVTVLRARTLCLVGRADEAERLLAGIDRTMGSVSRLTACVARLAAAELALRRGSAQRSLVHIERATTLAQELDDATLEREAMRARALLVVPVAVVHNAGERREVGALELESIRDRAASERALVFDGMRRSVSLGSARVIDLAARPVLFDLLATLARHAPAVLARDALAAGAYGVARVNESHRARLRVEIGRVRRALDGAALRLCTTKGGYALDTGGAGPFTFEPLTRGPIARVRALTSDGRAWSADALGKALALSKRTVSRALCQLEEDGVVRRLGSGRRTLFAAVTGAESIATQMLLLGMSGAT